jgi:hypothetical protein
MTDESPTGTFQFTLPEELLTASKRQPKLREDGFKVEGWRTSWFSKVSEMLIGQE